MIGTLSVSPKQRYFRTPVSIIEIHDIDTSNIRQNDESRQRKDDGTQIGDADIRSGRFDFHLISVFRSARHNDLLQPLIRIPAAMNGAPNISGVRRGMEMSNAVRRYPAARSAVEVYWGRKKRNRGASRLVNRGADPGESTRRDWRVFSFVFVRVVCQTTPCAGLRGETEPS